MKNTAANGYRCPSYKCTLNHNVTMSPYSALKKNPNGQSLPKGRSGHHLWLSRAVNNLSVALQEVPNMAHKEKLTYILLSAILCFLCAPSKIYIPTLVAHNFMEMQFAWQGAKKWPTKTSNRKYFFSLLATFLRTRFFSLQFCLFFFSFCGWVKCNLNGEILCELKRKCLGMCWKGGDERQKKNGTAFEPFLSSRKWNRHKKSERDGMNCGRGMGRQSAERWGKFI